MSREPIPLTFTQANQFQLGHLLSTSTKYGDSIDRESLCVWVRDRMDATSLAALERKKKVALLKEKLGFNDAFNYKEEKDLKSTLKSGETSESVQCRMSRNRWSSFVYRKGHKHLTRLFLREAEHALQLALSEGN